MLRLDMSSREGYLWCQVELGYQVVSYLNWGRGQLPEVRQRTGSSYLRWDSYLPEVGQLFT